jgi:hypothetical protein
MTISGNTAGQSSISGTNIVFAGGDGVTLSASTAAGAATISVNVNTAPDLIAIVGNTSGTASTFTGDTFYLSGGNNITLSNNAGTIAIHGNDGGGLPQIAQSYGTQGATATSSIGHRSLYIAYCPIQDNISVNRLDQYGSIGHAATTSFTTSTAGNTSVSAAAVNSWTFGKTLGLYVLGSGTNSTRLESISGSTSMSIGATKGYSYSFSISSNSATHGATNGLSIAVVRSIDLSGNATYSTIPFTSTASNTASSAAVITTTTGTTSVQLTISGGLQGQKLIVHPWATTLTPGGYWVAQIHQSSSTSVGTNSTVMSVNQILMSTGSRGGVGHLFSQADLSNSHIFPNGVYSATTLSLPSTINFTQISAFGSQYTIPGIFMRASLS